jgi:hypothetical protein
LYGTKNATIFLAFIVVIVVVEVVVFRMLWRQYVRHCKLSKSMKNAHISETKFRKILRLLEADLTATQISCLIKVCL